MTAILLVTLAALSACLRFDFVYDDWLQIVSNQHLTSAAFIGRFFSEQSWSHDPASLARLYRPIFLLWLFIERSIFGLNPAGWHAVNLAAHLAATLLAGLIARRFSDSRFVGITTAILFGVHPTHVETAAWISDIDDSLLTIFLFAATLFFLRAREWKESPAAQSNHMRPAIIALGFFVLALFTKETAIVFPVVVVVIIRYWPKQPNNGSRGWPAVAPFLVCTIGYLLVRHAVLYSFGGSFTGVTVAERILTLPSAFWFYLRILFWPNPLSEFYYPQYVDSAGLRFWLPLLLEGALFAAVVALYRRTRDRTIAVAAVWFIAFIGPAMDLDHLGHYDFLHERYVYCSSFGLFLLLAWGLERVHRRLIATMPRVIPALILGLTVGFASATYAASLAWRDDVALNLQAIKVAPHDGRPFKNLAVAFCARGRYAEGLQAGEMALVYEAPTAIGERAVGCNLYGLGRLIEARTHLARALRLDALDAPAHFYLAMTEWKLGDTDSALSQFQQAIAAQPAAPFYHLAQGMLLQQVGNYPAARESLQAELKLFPTSIEAQRQLQSVPADTSAASADHRSPR